MSAHVSSRLVHLKPRQLLDIHDGSGLTVRAVAGAVWITQSGDSRDIVLGAGQSFTLDRPGLTLVSALTGATVTVSPASGRAKLPAVVDEFRHREAA